MPAPRSRTTPWPFRPGWRIVDRSGITRIPVVVHVVWNTATQNVSDAQILSQIDVLNRDFRRTNPDVAGTPAPFLPLTADSRIEFFLADTDPNGAATNGIVRRQTTVASFGHDDAMKTQATGGSDAWPADRYLNLWVCPLSGGLLGYAQFPGGPAATDGVGHPPLGLRHHRHRGGPLQPGPHGHPRDRPLAQPQSHLGRRRHRLQRHRQRGRHAQPGRLQRRRAELPPRLVQQRPERRHVHELHGLHRRPRHVHVHRRPGGAHAGLPGRPAQAASAWPPARRAAARARWWPGGPTGSTSSSPAPTASSITSGGTAAPGARRSRAMKRWAACAPACRRPWPGARTGSTCSSPAPTASSITNGGTAMPGAPPSPATRPWAA